MVATYDIFPTILTLAGAKVPTDRVIDRRDMSPVLFDGQMKSQHDCLFHYKGSGKWGSKQPGLWAVRCGKYKIHYVITSKPANVRYLAPGVVQDPPLIYHIERDISEQYPLKPESAEYIAANKVFVAAVAAHVAELEKSPVPNQMGKGGSNDLVVCGCPQSQQKYPKYPNCTCSPENFADSVFVCRENVDPGMREDVLDIDLV